MSKLYIYFFGYAACQDWPNVDPEVMGYLGHTAQRLVAGDPIEDNGLGYVLRQLDRRELLDIGTAATNYFREPENESYRGQLRAVTEGILDKWQGIVNQPA